MTARTHGLRDDSGVILVIVLVMALLLVGLTAAGLALSRSGANLSMDYQANTSSRLTAESGVEATLVSMRSSGSIPSLPCTLTGSPGSGSSTYSVTITYYASGTPLTCSGGSPVGTLLGGTSIPTAATITSSGTAAHGGTVVMVEQVSISPDTPLAPAFDYAIFTPGTMPLSVQASIYKASNGAPADLYSGQTFQCTNSVYDQGSLVTFTTPQDFSSNCQITGSITVNGNVDITNTATIGGDVYAIGGAVSMSSSAKVGGSVYATGGGIDLSNNAVTIGGSAYATGSITQVNLASVGGQTWPNDASYLHANDSSIAGMTMPPSPTFPTINPSVSQWQAAGYTVIQIPGTDPLNGKYYSCSAHGSSQDYFTDQYPGGTDMPSQFVDDVNSATTPIVIYAPTCNPSIGTNLVETGGPCPNPNNGGKGSVFNMNANVAVVVNTFSDWGCMLWQPTPPSSGPENLAIIAESSGSNAIDLTNYTDFASTVNTLLYSPGEVTFSVDSTMTGQILAGTEVNATNNFSMTYSTAAAQGIPGTTVNASPTVTRKNEYLAQD